MIAQREKMREDAQVRILRLLQDNPEMSQRELAKAVGVSDLPPQNWAIQNESLFS